MTTRRLPRGVPALLAASATTIGLLVSSVLISVVIAGALQWKSLPSWVDNVVPLLVLVGGMVLTGRVAVDVAGRLGVWACLIAAVVVGLLGMTASNSSEAHGDGVEPTQVLMAIAAVVLITGGAALWTVRRRRA